MAKRIVILGAGAAARYVSYILSYGSKVDVVGFTDPDSDKWGTEVRGWPVLGSDDMLSGLRDKGVRHAIIGVGSPAARHRLRTLASDLGFGLMKAVHPSAVISPDVELGDGIVVEAGAVMSDNPVLHDNVWIGISAWVAHDSSVGKDSAIGGGAMVGAEVKVGQRVALGMGAVIQSGRIIGDDAVIGSGANVVHDVPPGAVVVGNPAKAIRYRDGY